MFEQHVGTGLTAVVSELDHTADVALAIEAESPADLFAGAALGMARVMTGGDEIAEDDSREIEIADIDAEALLVQWLNNLLEMYDADGFLPATVEVHLQPPAMLRATVTGAPDTPARILIKAATFHMLRIDRGPVTWNATVVFDV